MRPRIVYSWQAMQGSRRGWAAGLLLGLALAGCGVEGETGEAATPASAPTFKSSTALGTELVDLINQHRVSRGLDALVDWSPLAGVARDHSADMATRHYFSHIDSEGRTAGDRLTEAGLSWSAVGENLAAGQGSPEDVFLEWMASPGHRENIEGTEWTHTGAGYAYDGDASPEFPYGHYWTQNFLRP